MIRAIIFLDDLLIFGNTLEEILIACDSVIFLLQHLGFVINFKKCVLEPTQEIEFLGMIVNSKTMTLTLPLEKVQKIKNQCLEIYQAQEITLLELTRLLGTLASTIQAILPARLQFRYLQQQQISTLRKCVSFMTKVKLNPLAKEELAWWIKNLELSNGRSILFNLPHSI